MTKVAIVTGASGGMGAPISVKFARQGYQVWMVARNENKLKILKNSHPDLMDLLIPLPCDLSNPDQIRHLPNRLDLLSDTDVLVNCAGGAPIGNILDLSLADWQKHIQLKLLGYIQMIKIILPIMLKNNSGTIINIAGIQGKQPEPDFAIEGVLNAAIMALTKSTSQQVRQHNITVNTINPGATATGLWDKVAGQLAQKSSHGLKQTNENLKEQSEIKRLVNPSAIAELAYFLSTDAGHYINGDSIAIDGGVYQGI